MHSRLRFDLSLPLSLSICLSLFSLASSRGVLRRERINFYLFIILRIFRDDETDRRTCVHTPRNVFRSSAHIRRARDVKRESNENTIRVGRYVRSSFPHRPTRREKLDSLFSLSRNESQVPSDVVQ